MKAQKVKGRLILKEIEFNKVWKKTVTKNNDTSGKIQLPKDLIGKEVYIILEGDGGKN